eukprot:jgi/Antlo1/1050/1014
MWTLESLPDTVDDMAKGALREGVDDDVAEDTEDEVEEGGVLLVLCCLEDTDMELALPELVSSPSNGRQVIMTLNITETQARFSISWSSSGLRSRRTRWMASIWLKCFRSAVMLTSVRTQKSCSTHKPLGVKCQMPLSRNVLFCGSTAFSMRRQF